MSISSYNSTTGELTTYAGSPNVDQVLSASSKNPIANKAVYNALAEKIEKTVNDLVNYYTMSQVYNKAEVRELIGAINTLTLEVVGSLPTSDISDTTIYLVGPTSGNYDEYIHVGNTWVKIGDTQIDLSNYVTSEALTTALQSYYTKTAVDALLDSYYTKSEVDTELNTKQDSLTFDNEPTNGSANPVKSGGVYSALVEKQDTLTFDNTPTSNSDNPVKSDGVYDADKVIQDQVNEICNTYGSKNLWDIEGWMAKLGVASNYTKSGNVYTITASSAIFNTPYQFADSNITIKISGKLENGTSTNARIDFLNLDGTVVRTVNNSSSDFDIEISGVCKVRLNWSQHGTFILSRPMIRMSSIKDTTYAPYAMTNRELTNQKIDLYGLTSSTAVWQGDTLTFKITPANGIMYHLIAMEAARQDTDKGIFCEAYIIMRAQGATAPNIRNRGTDNIVGTWDSSSSSLIITLPKTSFWMYRFSVEALHPSLRI